MQAKINPEGLSSHNGLLCHTMIHGRTHVHDDSNAVTISFLIYTCLETFPHKVSFDFFSNPLLALVTLKSESTGTIVCTHSHLRRCCPWCSVLGENLLAEGGHG